MAHLAEQVLERDEGAGSAAAGAAVDDVGVRNVGVLVPGEGDEFEQRRAGAVRFRDGLVRPVEKGQVPDRLGLGVVGELDVPDGGFGLFVIDLFDQFGLSLWGFIFFAEELQIHGVGFEVIGVILKTLFFQAFGQSRQHDDDCYVRSFVPDHLPKVIDAELFGALIQTIRY